VRLYQVSDGATTRFGYDGGEIVLETDGANAVLRRYVKGAGADETLVWYEGSGSSNPRWLYADERGSVVAITDGAGSPLATNTYDEYGRPGSGNLGRFQYTGQAYIASLGLYYYKARFYAPSLGKFLQPDPIGYAGGMNLYAYVGGDPVNLVDSRGLEAGAPTCNGRLTDCSEEVTVTATRRAAAAAAGQGILGGAAGVFGTPQAGAWAGIAKAKKKSTKCEADRAAEAAAAAIISMGKRRHVEYGTWIVARGQGSASFARPIQKGEVGKPGHVEIILNHPTKFGESWNNVIGDIHAHPNNRLFDTVLYHSYPSEQDRSTWVSRSSYAAGLGTLEYHSYILGTDDVLRAFGKDFFDRIDNGEDPESIMDDYIVDSERSCGGG